MSFDAIFGAFMNSMGGTDLLLVLLSLVIVAAIAFTLVRPFVDDI